MKLFHIPAKSNLEIKIPASELKKAKLPKRVGLVTTIQHLHQLPALEKQIKGARIVGQIVGCRVDLAEKAKDKVDAFLFIGTGEFHPIAVALKTNKPVFVFNPVSQKLSKLDEQTIADFRQQRKGALIKFLHAKNVGILVSTKHGQQRFSEARKLKRKLESEKQEASQGKKCYIFIFDTLDFSQLENFPFIDSWLNTACPRIADGRNDIINFNELP
jgi:2-(3-amino-3-carboxypropyl)histidine synthase